MWKIITLLIWTATLLGCQKTPGQKTAELQRITVAYTYQPQSTLVHIAMAKKYFLEEGLDVQSSMHTYGKAALQAVIDNTADFATVAETPLVFNILDGKKIFVIANIEASTTNNAIVARKDAGILKPADLKGKRIGFTAGTTSDFFLDSMLIAQGLMRQEIQAIAIKPEDMQEAIMAKRLDAVSTWNYSLTLIKRQLATNGVIFYDRDIYTETFNIATLQSFAINNPDAIKRFLRALIKAENFVAKFPGEAEAIMSAVTKIDVNLIHEVWADFQYRVVLDQKIVIIMEDEARWAMKNQLTKATVIPDFGQYIYSAGLMEVKPDALKIHL